MTLVGVGQSMEMEPTDYRLPGVGEFGRKRAMTSKGYTVSFGGMKMF